MPVGSAQPTPVATFTAQDAKHDAFLIALQRLDTLHNPATPGAWLHAITRNACLQSLRTSARVRPLDALSSRESLRSPEPSPEERIGRLALKDWVGTALAALPETSRATAMLRYLGARSTYEENADVFGVPIGTVKSRIN